MSIFTIAPDLLRNITLQEKKYYTDILLAFTNTTNKLKVAKDIQGEVMRVYRSIIPKSDIIKIWFDLISAVPTPFENIDVDLSITECEETKFVMLCSATVEQQKLIVYSLQNIKSFNVKQKVLRYNDVEIDVLDKDDAWELINNSYRAPIYNIKNSQVAVDHSSITKSEIK